MTWNPTATLQALQTALRDTEYFTDVLIGEPFSPPVDNTAAIFVMTFDPAGTMLNTTSDIWTFCVRVFTRRGDSPEAAEAAELALALGLSQIETALAGGFTLGDNVRAIDWYGEAGSGKLGAKWGHLDFGGTQFRMVDITVPVIVDDSASFVA